MGPPAVRRSIARRPVVAGQVTTPREGEQTNALSNREGLAPNERIADQGLACNLDDVIMTVGLAKTFPGDIQAVESLDLTVAAG